MKKILAVMAVIVVALGVYMYVQQPKESKMEIRQINEETEAYIIKITYPVFSGTPALAKASVEVKKIVDAEVGQFMEQVSDTEQFRQTLPPDDQGFGAESALYMDYHGDRFAAGIISGHFDVSNYASGAAHPNNYTDVFNYDHKHEKVLNLADIFKAGSGYEQVLAGFAQAGVKAQFKQREIPEDAIFDGGLDPKPENYQNFILTENNLVLFFDPYQVASYAAGRFEVEIPYEKISGMLAPDVAILLTETAK